MRLIVVGGGVAGLAAAHRALEWSRERDRPIDLAVLEAGDRLGGTILTERREGFLVECGPDSFLSEKPWALALCRRLGIDDRLLRTDDRFRRTFVVFRGRLHPLPDGFQLMAPTRLRPFLASGLFSWTGKLRMGLDLVLPRGGDPDESLGHFVRRRLGRQALERVAQPLVAGIYTADPDELSLAATMPRFLELERRERSLILAMWRAARRAPAEARGTSGARWSLFVTLADGMEELVRALANRLGPGIARLKERVSGVTREDGRWRVS
ncbi:MAG TPA: protoporphyrinogen oxidase, partial [Candidatus Methylomirabilis sp.]|nr:protoporphyrinogen oxidase [Candidatus Methylomirabilis sp.]